MGARFSGLTSSLFDSKKRQFLGRDGAGWTKLGVFYFFFYLGLAGFFCAMLAVFMALSPRDRPAYYSESSRMCTRTNPLSPGLGFRPQPDPDKNLIFIDKNAQKNGEDPFAKSLYQYLQIYYWTKDPVEKVDNEYDEGKTQVKTTTDRKFIIKRPGDCTNTTQYGYAKAQPCVLVKMNKIVGFVPKPGAQQEEKAIYAKTCKHKQRSIAIHCQGEYPADEDNIGNITYISENTMDDQCGSLDVSWFPYEGKRNRRDVYQAPYIWVQFKNPKPNILINVMCRAFGQNINFDKKSGRALTRFQIFIKDEAAPISSRRSGDM